ncbi:MAG: gamma-glutamyltransferase family protein [Thaumarchaeota archaeon]|nr:MAG: gamma-glutamyltransferase family protein [Nitrososphaerota archaeon]
MVLSRVLLASKFAVASEHPLASVAGHEAMVEGGNAIDAVAATSFALSVLQPALGGIGGDFFALFYEAKTGKVHCINSSGWAPSRLTPKFLEDRGHRVVPSFGPFSVVVPGLVKGVHAIQKRFGRLEFSTLLSRAIEYAKDGFAASQGLSNSLRACHSSLSEDARRAMASSEGPPDPGELIRQKSLAKALQDIAEAGPRAFYNGWIAESICEELSGRGVPITIRDFADFEPEWVDPLEIDYRGATVHEVPPNSMGATTLLILSYLRQIDLKRLRPNSRERIELTLKAAQAAYRKRDSTLGDPRFAKINLDEFLEVEGEKRPLIEREQRILGDADTTYFAVADDEGNLVSAIQSLFHYFGSRVYVKDCGVFLNNRGSAFRLSGPNGLAPRKRPLHTLSALLLGKGDEPTMALGCSGGDLRPQQHALFTTNIVDYSMGLESAIDFPRFLWEGGHTLNIERGYTGLRNLPFEVHHIPYPGRSGVAQGVQRVKGSVKAVCDVRGDGLPVGR